MIALTTTAESANAAAGTITSGSCSAVVGETTTASITQVGNDCVLSFNSGSNTWTIASGVTRIDLLAVGGGGGGGADGGSGGGGGEMRKGTNLAVTSGTLSVTVGAGGNGGAWGGGGSTNGAATTVSGGGLSPSFTANGGTAGGGWTTTTGGAGGSGGSGGSGGTGISATSATASSNFTYTLKWRPQSYLEYYRVVVTTPAGEVLSYWTKTPDWRLNDKASGKYLFEITAQGEGDSLSEPVRFAATVTTPINISSKLPTKSTSDCLTTFTSNQLKSIANRLTAQTVVTVTTYYDPKLKGAKKLAAKRVARAAATVKVAKSTLEVRTQVRPTTSKKSLTQITLTTKAPARKLTLTNA